jgi:hypothetical protein
MKNFFFLSIILLFLNFIFIICNNITCFEYSCAECESEYYGTCTACRPGFHLIDGTCPCSDISCALCTNGLAGLSICKLCKNGYYRMNDDCYCEVDNCEVCAENGCKKCLPGYNYNSTNKLCQKQEDDDINKIKCFDDNCDICISGEKGACDSCKKGYYYEKGECFKSPTPNDTYCGSGFYFRDGVCDQVCMGVECTKNEIFYYTCPSNPCLVCSDKELKVFTECNNSNICTKEGCLNCINDDYCLICDQGYYIISGICKKCIYGCSICSNNDTCDYCLSGFELNPESKQCELILDKTNGFDFDIKKYKNYKYKLIKQRYPKEQIREEDLEEVKNINECPQNCNKCYDSSGLCKECNQLYKLETSNNTCNKHCTLENCKNCYLKNGYEKCSECELGYYIKDEKCVYNCTDKNCLSCYLLDGKELCTQCAPNYNLENLKCKSKTKIITIIYIIITGFLFIILIICFCYYRQKLIERRRELMREINGNVIPYRGENGLEDSSRRSINKDEILDEFEKMKSKIEKGNQTCQFCKKKPGKYQCDCGCIVCKEHSLLKNVEQEGKNMKVCFNCGKPVQKVNPIKYDCNICFQKRINVVHFKCNCAILVCKDCYLKCRLESDKCPGCRSMIG